MLQVIQTLKLGKVYGCMAELLCESIALAPDGLALEFGVGGGYTINILQEYRPVYGFDSFLGLPEDWTNGHPEGTFSSGGRSPKVGPNVRLVVGWFKDTLPQFLEDNPDPISFLHIDSDLYSSADTVLRLVEGRLCKGAVINFNEFWDYPGCEGHEALAFQELLDRTGREARCIGRTEGTYTKAAFVLD